MSLLMFVPMGANTYTVRCADGTGCLQSYRFSLGSLLLRELLGGDNNLHRLEVPGILAAAGFILVVCCIVYALATFVTGKRDTGL